MNLNELFGETLIHLPAGRLLEGLSPSQAEAKLAGAPHSIAEIVAHLVFWQDWFLGRVKGSGEPMASTAALGWPAVQPGEWPLWEARFLRGLEEAAKVDWSERAVEPAFEFPPMAHHSAADVAVHLAVHNAHHLGQVIVLRQLMGLWPPTGGGWTW
jgi:uncharacterized damage-inducible protein DinB